MRWNPALPVAFALLLAGSAAHAVDGVLEINQTCASTGCFSGDEPGFPVEITHSGSYRLTSNLSISFFNADQPFDLIQISASDVTLDLGGFAVSCFKTDFANLNPHRCTGLAYGIIATGDVEGVMVRNGTVRGMAYEGIHLALGDVENIRAFDNGSNGIWLFFGQVRNSRSEQNGGAGIHGTVVDGCLARNNGANDIFADGVRNSILSATAAGSDLGGNLHLP